MLRACRPTLALQQSAAYRRLVKQLPANLVFFDGMCPYCESNIHYALTKNMTWPDDSDKILHVCPINSPDAKYVLSHFPHTLYRVAERINAGEPADTMVLIEKRPNKKLLSAAQKNLTSAERKRAETLGDKPPDPTTRPSLMEDVGYDVNVFVKSEAVFRIGQKLDDWLPRWAATLGYWIIPRWFANERYDKIAGLRFDKWGRHTKMPSKYSDEIEFRRWKLKSGELPKSIR